MSEDATGAVAVPSAEPTMYDKLAARFPASAHKTKTIGGTGLTYVDGETVISRLNDALGFDGWSFEVRDVKVLEDEVWALGRMTIYAGALTIVREQAGGQIINRTRGTPAIQARPAIPAEDDRPEQPAIEAQPARKGHVIELSNDIKGAITDCLKKCATLAGVALYLYDPSERREVEQEMRQGARPKAPATTGAAGPGTPASRSATTQTASSAKPTSSSTATTPAPETIGQRWARLVAEAEQAQLSTLGMVKAIDPKACGESQMIRYCELLEDRLAEAKQAAA